MLAQAKRLDSGEVVEGYYIYKDIIHSYIKNKHYITEQSEQYITHEIDQKTLKYSFDNSESWYSEDEIRGRIKYCNTFVSKYSIDE